MFVHYNGRGYESPNYVFIQISHKTSKTLTNSIHHLLISNPYAFDWTAAGKSILHLMTAQGQSMN